MVISWIGTAAVLINKLRCKLYRIENIRINTVNDITRIGVYYMCIDDLAL